MHVDIYSLYRGRFYIWAADCVRSMEDFVISSFVVSRFCYIHFACNFAGLKNIVRYSEDFVII